MSNYRSTLWHVHCAKCKQRYETFQLFKPERCGACSSSWIAVLTHEKFLKERHIPDIKQQ